MPNPITSALSASRSGTFRNDTITSPPRSPEFLRKLSRLENLLNSNTSICDAALADAANRDNRLVAPAALAHPEIADRILGGIQKTLGNKDYMQALRTMALSCSAFKDVARRAQTLLRSTGPRLLNDIALAPHIETLIIDGPCTAEQIKAIRNAKQLKALIAIGSGHSFVEAFAGEEGGRLQKLPLQSLNLSHSDMSDIPVEVMNELPSLTDLVLVGCNNLTTLPDQLPVRLETLDLRDCSSLQALPEVPQWTFMKRVDLRGCPVLQSLPRDLRARLSDLRATTVDQPFQFAVSIENGPIRIAPRLAPPPMTNLEAYRYVMNRISAVLDDEPSQNQGA